MGRGIFYVIKNLEIRESTLGYSGESNVNTAVLMTQTLEESEKTAR
jgi:hypothetical protein